MAQLAVSASARLGLDVAFRRHLENLTQETFISFAAVQDAVSIWVADDRGMQFFVADMPLASIRTLSGELLALLADPASNPRRIQWLSRRLYRVLIGPIAHLLEPSRSMAVHCSRDLRCVPMGLLESDNGELLLERSAFWNTAGLPCPAEKPRIKTIPNDARLLIVDAPGLHALNGEGLAPSAGEHLLFASTAFPFNDKLSGAAATREEFDRLTAQAEMLHFHGTLSMADDGLQFSLAPDSVDRASLPLLGFRRLALPRCAMGVMDVEYLAGELQDTSDLWQGMCQALHFAGIANVVLPRWNVPAEVRRIYFECLYGELKNGVCIADASRRATMKLRAASEWRHPHYWAGFALSNSHL